MPFYKSGRRMSVAEFGAFREDFACSREKQQANKKCCKAMGFIKHWSGLSLTGLMPFLGFAKPTVGFEPTTTGLQNQSSTVELRWQLKK